MKKIISYPLSVIFYFFFGLTLLVMHVVQWLVYNLFGYNGHHTSVKWLNFLLMRCTNIMFTTYSFKGKEKLPRGYPLVFVSNHQSMFDISPLEYYLSDFHPKFVSKIELGSGIPSVSYNLVKGGSALIERNNPKQALSTIKELGIRVSKNNHSVVIFPEGTRSKTHRVKPFKENGLKILHKYAKNAYFVPVTINNSWKLLRYGKFPIGVGSKVSITVHDPISTEDISFDDLLLKLESTVKSAIIESND